MDTLSQTDCPQCGADLQYTQHIDKAEDELYYCYRCQLPLVEIAGKYRLEKKLGEGGNGVIYLARHQALELTPLRVIKFLKQEAFANTNALQRFRREIQVTASISDENQHIVRVFDDFGEVPGLGPFYVMEFLQGVTLEDALLQETLPIPTILHIFEQLCLAIQSAHQHDVLHRDLKPSNIFLVRRGEDPYFVKVMDFGLAKPFKRQTAALTAEGMAPGTPLYMSPEQFLGEPCDHRSDIYAMGLLLYEMLTGESPFESMLKEDHTVSIIELAQAHIFTMPEPPSKLKPERKIHPSLDWLTQRCISKKPDERYDNVESILKDVLGVREELGLHYKDPLQQKKERLRETQRLRMELQGQELPTPNATNVGEAAPPTEEDFPLPPTLNEPPDVPVLEEPRSTLALENKPVVAVMLQELENASSPKDTLEGLQDTPSSRLYASARPIALQPDEAQGVTFEMKGVTPTSPSKKIVVAKGIHTPLAKGIDPSAHRAQSANEEAHQPTNHPPQEQHNPPPPVATASTQSKPASDDTEFDLRSPLEMWEGAPYSQPPTHSQPQPNQREEAATVKEFGLPAPEQTRLKLMSWIGVLILGLVALKLWVFNPPSSPQTNAIAQHTEARPKPTKQEKPGLAPQVPTQKNTSSDVEPPKRQLEAPPPRPTIKTPVKKRKRRSRRRKRRRRRRYRRRWKRRTRRKATLKRSRPKTRKPTKVTKQASNMSKTPGCPADNKNQVWIRFRVQPSTARVTFSLPFQKVGRWYCVRRSRQSQRIQIRVKRAGYYPCLIRRSFSKRDISLRLKKEPEGVLASDPPLSHCLR